MGAFVLDGMKGAVDVEEGDVDPIQHDTGGTCPGPSSSARMAFTTVF